MQIKINQLTEIDAKIYFNLVFIESNLILFWSTHDESQTDDSVLVKLRFKIPT